MQEKQQLQRECSIILVTQEPLEVSGVRDKEKIKCNNYFSYQLRSILFSSHLNFLFKHFQQNPTSQKN